MKNEQQVGFNMGVTKQVKLSKIQIKNIDKNLMQTNKQDTEVKIRETCLNMLKKTRD
jgi:hypothetical protein